MLVATALQLGRLVTATLVLMGVTLVALHKTRRANLPVPPPGGVGAWQQTATRTLVSDFQQDCAAYGISDEEFVAAIDNPTLSLGDSVVDALAGSKRSGGKEGTWYEDTLTSLLVEYCEEAQQSVHHRYVTSENATAAKDEYGVCIQTLDGDQNAYAAGLCEREANCYWEEPRVGEARNRRYTDGQYAADERAAKEYVSSAVLNLGTLGLVLGFVVFAGCIKFAISRGVYNKCLCDSDLQRDRIGYTNTEQKTPAFIFVVGLVTVAVAGVLGIQGNSHVTTGLEAMFTSMREAIEGTRELVSSVSSPLSDFFNLLDTSTYEVELLLSSTDWLGEFEDSTLLRLDAFNSAHRHRFQGRDREYDTLAEEVENAADDFVSAATTDLYAAMDVLQQDFLGTTDVMRGQGGNLLAALTVVNDTAADNYDRLAYFRGLSDDYISMRTTSVQALVVSIAVAGAAGLLGVVAGLSGKCTPCVKLLRLTCIVAFTTTWMSFILSSVVVVGAVIWSDTCQWLKLAAAVGWETAGLDGQSARVLDGCFRGQPVADKLNLTDTLGFFDSYVVTAEEVRVLDVTAATTKVNTAVYTLSDFVQSLNATEVAVSLLDFYTNGQVNGSLLLDPDCPYNVSFEGEATDYLGQPWLALPTVETAAADTAGGNSPNVSAAALTSWEAGGTRQSFGRHAGESASSYMSRVFNSSDCSSLNDDLFSAWDQAARQDALRDEMKDDLTCIVAIATTTSDTDDDADSATTLCSSNSSSSLSSSAYSLSSCSCTSENYTAPDSLLAYFATFAGSVIDLRAELAGLLNISTAVEERGSLESALFEVTSARCASRCAFIPSHYDNFEGAMCGTTLSGLAQVGFCMFLFGAGGLALAVTSGIMVHRLKAAWAKNMGKVLTIEEGIVMEEY